MPTFKWVFPPQLTQLWKSLTGLPTDQPNLESSSLILHPQVILDCTKWKIKTDASNTKTRPIIWPHFATPGYQAEYTSAVEQVNKMWCIRTREFYTAVKKNEITMFADKWMDRLARRNKPDSERETFHVFSPVQTLKYANRAWNRKDLWDGRQVFKEREGLQRRVRRERRTTGPCFSLMTECRLHAEFDKQTGLWGWGGSGGEHGCGEKSQRKLGAT